MTSDINDESIEVLCKLLLDTIKVNPEARPVVVSLVDTLMDNQVRREDWGTVLFCMWQELQDESNRSSGGYHDGNGQ